MNSKPNENKIKEAFDQIELPEGAQERMYQNILKKAEAARSQAEPSNAEVLNSEANPPEIYELPTEKKSFKVSWRKYAAIAACLVIFIAAGSFLPGILNGDPAAPTVPDDPPVLAGSPFIDVSGPQDFETQLGFSINAPDGAEDIGFCIAYENTAIVTFTWNGHSYDYSASEDAENLSGSAEVSDGTLSEIWQTDDLSFCLVNTDGTSQSEFDALVQVLQSF